SVMSKKIAAGAACIVLDVKFGSGAFIKSREAAQEMADAMVAIGRACGRRMSAVVNSMDQPLGNAVGNALEVREAVDVLKNACTTPCLREQSLTLAAHMISMALDISIDDALTRGSAALTSGAALEKFRLWISSQGGDVGFIRNNDLPLSPLSHDIVADKCGEIVAMDTQKIGEAACHLGAGRKVMTDTIDPGAGIYFHRKPGKVTTGDKVATLYSSYASKLEQAVEMLNSSLIFGE
ncbi:MAG: hypothetical protein FWB93_06140, partial [Oscillospiraceae bacterium]|nr:hypothetical protein [Oscillospiraceae bacterium]